MSEQQRRLVRLRDRYPTASRMTRWRIRNQPGFPDGIDQNGTEYFYDDELEAHEESRRRRKARPSSAEKRKAAATETSIA
jgi:hypothetical protein